jgi:kumamolisin
MNSGFSNYAELEGSNKIAPPGERRPGIDKGIPISISVYVRPQQPFAAPAEKSRPGKGKPLSRNRYQTRHGAIKSDLDKVTQFAHHSGLGIVRINEPQRLIELRGTVSQMEKAFNVELDNYSSENGILYRGRSGSIHIPSELKGIVEGVFGLDDRPIATPKFQVFKSALKENRTAGPTNSFYPNQLAEIYTFPPATGKNQRIAIIELGGGYRAQDISNYFTALGIATPNVIGISIDGGANNPSTSASADGEVMLDIEVAGAIAPDALLAVYFAPNTDKGFLDAINAAIHNTQDATDIISISWGAAESAWTAQSLKVYNAAFQAAASLGITVCAAAGDNGSSDGVKDGLAHVDFPSSSPYVLACGGTRLIAQGGKIQSETVWHESATSATGGGVSEVFALPAYQEKVNVPVSVSSNKKGRGVPDLAAVADPATGYNVLVDGDQLVIGGTSAVAPLMAGLIARINERRNKNVGFIHPELYRNTSAFRDITEGDNITTSGNKGYQAGVGWDGCTGCGVPIGSTLENVL